MQQVTVSAMTMFSSKDLETRLADQAYSWPAALRPMMVPEMQGMAQGIQRWELEGCRSTENIAGSWWMKYQTTFAESVNRSCTNPPGARMWFFLSCLMPHDDPVAWTPSAGRRGPCPFPTAR